MKPYLVALAASAAITASPALAAEWNMPTPYPEATFHTQNVMSFAEEIEEATGGSLQITVHPAGSLYEHPEIKNSVRRGLAEMGEVLISRLENENPIFAADVVPFLATSYEDARTLYEAQRPALEAALEEQGLTFLYAVPWPPQGLYTKTAVESAADLEGLRLRAYNASLETLARHLGAAPTQVEVPDLPTAFSTGRVDAMITSPTTGVNSTAWDYLSYYYDTKAWLPKNMVFVNTEAFEGLSEDEQAAVMAAAEAAEARGWEMSEAEATDMTEMLAENGITVGEAPADVTEAMNAAGEDMASEWANNAGEDGQAILDALN